MRKRWVVNPGFQLKYTIFIVVLVAGILGALGYMYVSVLQQQRELLGIQTLVKSVPKSPDDSTADFDRELRREAKREDLKKLLLLLILSGGLVIGLAVVALKVTHRIAGPVYAVSQTLRALAMGDLGSVRPLRKRDEFRFLYEDLVAVRDAMQRTTERTIELLETTLEALQGMKIEEEADRAMVGEIIAQIRDFIESQKRFLRRQSERD